MKGVVKKRLPLSAMHAKNAESEPRTELSNGEELKVPMKWYSLRMMLSRTKSRILYFETRQQRQEALAAILGAQGFAN